MAPAEGIGLHAAGVVRPREPRALVDVTQRRRPCGSRVVLVVGRDVEPEVLGSIVFVAAEPVGGELVGPTAAGVGERDLDLEVVAAGGP